MKQKRYILVVLLTSFIGFGLQAQVVIDGTNINIGENNTLNNTGNGYFGNAIGKDNNVQGANSLTVGYNNNITQYGYNSVALGSVNEVTGNSSMAVGSNVMVLQSYSMGIGRHLKVSNGYSVLIGNGITNPNTGPDVILENPYSNSLLIGFQSSKPTFSISPSPNTFGSVIDRTGKIAIGDVPMPDIAAKLHIRSDMEEDAGIILEPKDPENNSTFIRMRDEGHGIEVTNTGTMIVKSMDDSYIRPLILKGSVGINIPDNYIDDLEQQPIYSLCVKGGIVAEKVAIKECSTWWPDYVFSTDYQLMSLDHLREYISENRHLPDVPSESQVMEEGFELGEMQSILLKKIEELTLYTLELQEQMKAMQVEIDELKNK